MWKTIYAVAGFFKELLQAIKYSAAEYDEVLRRTKTPKQRYAIWLGIAGATFAFLLLVIFLLKQFILNPVLQLPSFFNFSSP